MIINEVVGMKTKVYFFRLMVGLTALFIGVSLYFVWQGISAQSVSAIPDLVKPVASASPVFVPLPPNEIKDLITEEPKTDEEAAYEFYPDGDYYPLDELPKVFNNIDFLEIAANDWSDYDGSENYQPKPIVPKGALHTEIEYKFAKISINNRLISFETEKVKGINYTFVGEYPKDGKFGNDEWVDLQGILKKFKNGKEVAKSKIGFVVAGC